ncbi:MAG TPA: hypothetical protein VFK59_12575 [Actinomycetota bacterium]|nr:hypothetical protein [Actinomycetota bacterium]
MKKAFPIMLVVLGIVFVGAGIYTVVRGFQARDEVRDVLVAQRITTPEDASIPNQLVDDAATAHSMALIIEKHAEEATGGRTYSELGRYLTPDGGDTSDEALALTDEAGNPVPNPLRNVAFQASTLQTSLHTSHMAFNVADLVIGLGVLFLALGVAVGGTGIAFAGLVIPTVARKFNVETVTPTTTSTTV